MQTQYKDTPEAEWQARALIKDNVQSKTYVAQVDIYALKNQKLRMDLISPIGDHLGSFLYNEGSIEILDVQNKKYFKGKSSESALRPLISLPLDPKDLFSALYEETPKTPGWSCKTKNETLLNCENAQSGVQIKWNDRVGSNRTIYFSHTSAEIQMNFKSYKNKINSMDVFTIKIPQSFKKMNLN